MQVYGLSTATQCYVINNHKNPMVQNKQHLLSQIECGLTERVPSVLKSTKCISRVPLQQEVSFDNIICFPKENSHCPDSFVSLAYFSSSLSFLVPNFYENSRTLKLAIITTQEPKCSQQALAKPHKIRIEVLLRPHSLMGCA